MNVVEVICPTRSFGMVPDLQQLEVQKVPPFFLHNSYTHRLQASLKMKFPKGERSRNAVHSTKRSARCG